MLLRELWNVDSMAVYSRSGDLKLPRCTSPASSSRAQLRIIVSRSKTWITRHQRRLQESPIENRSVKGLRSDPDAYALGERLPRQKTPKHPLSPVRHLSNSSRI